MQLPINKVPKASLLTGVEMHGYYLQGLRCLYGNKGELIEELTIE